MDAQQPPPDRPQHPQHPQRPQHPHQPNTLDQAWRGMAESSPRAERPPGLPILPDWPPLPDERPSPSAWPSLSPAEPNAPNAPNAPDARYESHPADALQPTARDEMLWPGHSGILHRFGWLGWFGHASKRARIGLAAAGAVALVVLIVACSSFALRATAGHVAPGSHGAANQSRTASALATATPQPTSHPTPTSAPPPPLTLAFTCASGKVRGTGQVCVHTLPGASLSLTVHYCDGSTAKGLHGSATADGSGNYTWSWPVHPTCAGPATAKVTATANGQSLTASDTFTITP